jgi:hypothetical protein
MIVVRGVFQAKYGKGDELVQLFKEGNEMWPSKRVSRLLTDLSGPFFTVVNEAEYDSFNDFVNEAEYDSFNDWEADAQKYFGDPRFAAWFERMTTLVESGRREFFTLVE